MSTVKMHPGNSAASTRSLGFIPNIGFNIHDIPMVGSTRCLPGYESSCLGRPPIVRGDWSIRDQCHPWAPPPESNFSDRSRQATCAYTAPLPVQCFAGQARDMADMLQKPAPGKRPFGAWSKICHTSRDLDRLPI